MSRKNITLQIILFISFCLAVPCEASIILAANKRSNSKKNTNQSNSNIISNAEDVNKADTQPLYTPDPAKDRVDISEIQNNLAPNAIADPKSKSSPNFQDRDSD